MIGYRSVIAISAATIFTAAAHAQSVEPFYKGKVVSVYVGSSAGGANDLYTRLLAKHMGRYLDGNPTLVVRNMPGAGSRKLASYIFSAALSDGTEFGLVDRNIFTEWLLLSDKTNLVDPRSLTWIGSPSQETLTCVSWRNSSVQSLDDLKTKPFMIGSTGAMSGESLAANILNATIGARVKTVIGYPGGAEMNLAMQRGETDGRCGLGWGAIKAGYQRWIEQGDMKVLIQTALESHPEITDIPVLGSLVKDNSLKQALTLLLADQRIGRPIIAPPKISANRKAELQVAFDKTIRDPEFLKDANAGNMEIRPVGAPYIMSLLKSIFELPESTVMMARKIANY